MSGYPGGAQFDSTAPYNKAECRICDRENLSLKDLGLDPEEYTEEEYDEAVDRYFDGVGLCRQCMAEEMADYLDD